MYKKDAKKRECIVCGVCKRIGEFAKHPECTNGRSGICYKCKAARARKWRREHPKAEKARQSYNRIYAGCQNAGISVKEYLEMFRTHNGKCDICGTPNLELKRNLSIDHNHETKTVRGLLCANCNLGLGNFKDSLDILAKAIEYIKIHKQIKIHKGS